MSTTITKPVGRPYLLTDQLQTDICHLIAAGNYLITACHAVGISDNTFTNWLERGQAEIDANDTAGKFFAFFRAVKKAEADREATMAQRVIDAAMPGVRKTVTKVATYQGAPIMGKDGKPVTYDEHTWTGGDWLAAMTFLERRHSERWGRPAPGNNNAGPNVVINVEKAIIDAAGKFDAIMARIAERATTPLAIPAGADVQVPDSDPAP